MNKMGGQRSLAPQRFAFYLILGSFLAVMLFPLYWMFVTSVKPNIEIYRVPPLLIPDGIYTGHYEAVLSTIHFLTYLWNNFFVAAMTTIIGLFSATLAGYAFSRYSSPIAVLISFGLLSTQMFPVIGIVIALYSLYLQLGILNTHTGLIFALVASVVPFATWMLKGFFDEMPRSLEESARVDGAGRFTVLFRIAIPLATPGLFAAGIYSFMLAWDDFLFALTLIRTDVLRTLSVGISLRYLGEVAYDWGQVTTVSVFGTVPMDVLFFI
ncbi:MAG: carbohydrate ABC transporter permease [Spirochaeta sp.]|jgi:multiple sugar transport system permease protein|nr:carbohydrate ABC transporter permease [Spirochaeta sp.]